MRDELLAAVVQDEERAHIEGPPVRLRAKAADSIGLAIHELATDAIKYWPFRIEEVPQASAP